MSYKIFFSCTKTVDGGSVHEHYHISMMEHIFMILRLGNGFLDMTPKIPATIGKIDKLDLIKI